MSFSEFQRPGKQPAVGDGNHHYPEWHHVQEPFKSTCPYEEHVVSDPNVSRIMLMLMRDFMSRGVIFEANDDSSRFSCPVMRCYESFERPTELLNHLPKCRQIQHGELNCLRCKRHHLYPTNETGWVGFTGWRQIEEPTTPRQRRSIGQTISDKLRRKSRDGPRNPSRSGSASSTGSVYSGPPISPVMPDPPMPGWNRFSPGDFPAATRFYLDPPAPEEPGPRRQELHATPIGGTLAGKRDPPTASAPSGILTPPRASLRAPPPYPVQMYPVDANLGGSGSDFSQKPYERPGFVKGRYPLSPRSSGDSNGPGALPQLLIPDQNPTLFFDEHGLTESPEGMAACQPGSQAPWMPATAAHVHPNTHAVWPPLNESLRPPADLQANMARHATQIHPGTVPMAAGGSGSWSSNDDNAFAATGAWHQLHPSPQEQLHHSFGDVPQSAVGAGLPMATTTTTTTTTIMHPGQLAAHHEIPGDLHGEWDAGEDEEDDVPELPGSAPPAELAASEYTCDRCDWMPKANGKPENFPNYLRKHKLIHDNREYKCLVPGCNRYYSRTDNLGKHIRDAHHGMVSVGASGGGGGGSGGGMGGGDHVTVPSSSAVSSNTATSSYRHAGRVLGRRRRQNVAEPEGPTGGKAGRSGNLRGARRKRVVARGIGAAQELQRSLLHGQGHL